MSSHQDEASISAMSAISEEVSSSQPLISSAVTPDTLLANYQDNESSGFCDGIRYLTEKYPRMRRVRGDGNCFYRAILFAYLEELILKMSATGDVSKQAKDEHARFVSVLTKSKSELVDLGFSEFTFECFLDDFLDLLERLPQMTVESLYEEFTAEGGHADAYTWYMRLLTSGYLRKYEERFFPFVLAEDASSASTGVFHTDMAGYCVREVEPMGKECEQLHIIALTECLGVRVSIEYLDGREFSREKGLQLISFPPDEPGKSDTSSESEMFRITLLYRPGHYDILYRA